MCLQGDVACVRRSSSRRRSPSSAPFFRHPDGLAVQDGGTRAGSAALLLTHAGAQHFMHRVQGPVVSPPPVLLPDCGPGWKVVRERSPGAAVLGLVEDGVPDLSKRVAARSACAAVLRSGHRRAHQRPLRVRQIGWVRSPSHASKLPGYNHFVHSFLGSS